MQAYFDEKIHHVWYGLWLKGVYELNTSSKANKVMKYGKIPRRKWSMGSIWRLNHVIQQVNNVSPADELRKYKELLDDGIITQDEFDAKKKQILGL